MMEQSALLMNKKECQTWLKTIGNADKHTELLKTLKMRVLAPYLYGEDYLPIKWRKWMEEAKHKIYIDKWLEVEPIDVDEYDKIDSLNSLLNFVSSQVLTNGVDLQRFMNLAVKMDKQTRLAQAKALAEEEVSFVRLWERCSPSTERSKVALMAVVFSYIRFAGQTVRKRDHHTEMTFLSESEQEEVEMFKTKGNDEHKMEHYSRAVTQYNKAIRKNRYCPVLYSNRCMAFLNMKKFNHALMDAKRALTLDPTWAKASYRFAQAMFELGYHRRAMQFNETTLEQCKKNNANDPYIINLERQKESFKERQMEKIALDDVPDLVDPSSSDSSDMDSDEQQFQLKDILKEKGPQERDKPRRSKLTIIDDECGLIQIPKSLVKSKSKERKEKDERKRQKAEEEEVKKYVKQEQKAEKAKEEEEIKHRERQKIVQERKKRENHTPVEQTKGSEQVKVPDESRELERQLQLGSEAMLEHRGRQAFTFYKAAMDLIGKSSKQYGGQREEDYVIFLYAYGMACLESGIDEEITDACHKFEMILENHSRIRSPLPYYGLSYALFKLNKFSDALEPLGKAKHMAKRFPIVVETWPGTKHKISQTEEGQMMIALDSLEDTCKQPPPPDATCRFESCPFKPEMYLTDVGFKGYVKVLCKERCHMDFHIACWKKIKAEEYPTVTHEKELLMKDCRTPDCDGVYIKVMVFGHDGLLKTEHQVGEGVKTKEKKNKGFKQQAKKIRKKQEVSKKQQKSEKGQDDDDRAENEEQEEKTESKKSSMETASAASSNTADGDDEIDEDEDEDEDDDIQVEAKHLLKKDDLQEDSMVRSVKPKTKKKKGKDKTSMTIEVKFLDVSERRMYSSEFVEDKNGACPGAPSYPVLDPVNPFSTPAHLQEAASDLERNFKPSKKPDPQHSQTEEEKSQIAALHMHFEEVLGRLGPVPIIDTLLGDELQQMPQELQTIVERFGGLSKFLLQSAIFSMIEDHVCLQKDSDKCQDLVNQSKALRLGNLPGDPQIPINLRKLSKDKNNSRANLAPEHFPNIRETLAGNSMEQTRRKQQSTSSTSTTGASQVSYNALDEIHVDNPESKDKGPAVDDVAEAGSYQEAAKPDNSDKDKVPQAFEANAKNGAATDKPEKVQHGVDQQKATTKPEKESRLKDSNVAQSKLTKKEKEQEEQKLREERLFQEDQKRRKDNEEKLLAFLDRKEKERLAKERGEPIEEYDGPPTILLGGGSASSLLDKIFFAKRPTKSTDKTKMEKKSSSGKQTEQVKSSGFSANAKPFVPTSSRKMNVESTDSKRRSQPMNSASNKTQESKLEELIPPSDFQLHSKPAISENESGFYSSSTSGESAESSIQNDQSLDGASSGHPSGNSVIQDHETAAISPRAYIKDADRFYDCFSDDKTLHESDEGTCVDMIPDAIRKQTPPTEKAKADISFMQDSKLSSDAKLVSDLVATAYANSVSVNSTSENRSSSDTKPTSGMNPASEAIPKPIANTSSTSNGTSNATPACNTTSTSETSSSAVTKPSSATSSTTVTTSNPETTQPLGGSQNSSNIAVSLDKYNNLLQKYTTLFNVCKAAADVKKAMKCTWTQYPKVTLRSRAINTGPDKILEGCRANEMRLHRNLHDTNMKFARLKERYDCDTNRLRDDVKQLTGMNTQYENEQSRHSQQLRDVKQSKEAEKMRFIEELNNSDANIQSLEAKIASLTKQLSSKDELLESTIQNFETERDLWTAEKMKLEEASGNLEMNQQMLVKRCQDAEMGVLNLRCAKDLDPIEAVIREGEFHINNCHTILQRNIPVGENIKDFLAAWEKCHKDNKALLAAHKAKYEELMQQVRKGVSLQQLQPPKPVRPFKGPQPMRPPGMRVPFGPHGPQGPPGPPGPAGPQHQQPPQSNQMAAKMTGAGGFPNQQQTDQRLPVTSTIQESKAATPVQVPTPVPVTVVAPTHAPAVTSSQAQVKEIPAQKRPAAPVSLAQLQSNHQQPAVTTNSRMQLVYAMAQGNQQYPQTMAQPVQQPPVPVTSVSINGAGQHAVILTSQPAPMQQASKPPQFEETTNKPAPAAQPQNPQPPNPQPQHPQPQNPQTQHPQPQNPQPQNPQPQNPQAQNPQAQNPQPQNPQPQNPQPQNPQPQNPQPRTNFEKIIFPLNNMFPMYNKVQLTKVIKEVRAANRGSLSGLSIEEIIHRAADLIFSQHRSAAQLQRMQGQGGRPTTPVQQQQLQGAAAMKKPTSSTAHTWEPAKSVPVSAWGLTSSEGFEYDDEEEDPCVICHEEMIMDAVTLHCGHKFHSSCIKQWLQEQRTCPTCRNYTLLPDEYPAPI